MLVVCGELLVLFVIDLCVPLRTGTLDKVSADDRADEPCAGRRIPASFSHSFAAPVAMPLSASVRRREMVSRSAGIFQAWSHSRNLKKTAHKSRASLVL